MLDAMAWDIDAAVGTTILIISFLCKLYHRYASTFHLAYYRYVPGIEIKATS